MTDERLDRIEADVRHLTRVLGDLMHEVRRNADAIAGLHGKSKDQEWEARFDFVHQPTSDRVDSTVSSLRHQAAEIHRAMAGNSEETERAF